MSAAVLAVVIALGCAFGVLAPAHGQLSDRAAVVRVLQESRDFRARARAALALGGSADPTMAAPLATALRDENPAVRAAAAEGLARIGGVTQLGALRSLTRDPERQVRDAAARAVTAIEARVHTPAPAPRGAAPPPTSSSPLPSVPVAPAAVPSVPPIHWAGTRYVVVLGTMANRSGYAHAPLATVLRSEVVRSLAGVRGVGILGAAPSSTEEQEISRRRIRRFRLDGSISTVRPQPGHDVSVRCEVSLMLLDDPGANLRAALNGGRHGHRARPRRDRATAAGARPRRARAPGRRAHGDERREPRDRAVPLTALPAFLSVAGLGPVRAA